MERWEALRLALGARGCLAARGGFTPRLKGAHWCPGASHRSIASRGSRGTLQTSDALRCENAEVWLFEIADQKLKGDAAAYSASYAGLTRVSITLRKSLAKRIDCRVKPGNDEIGSRARCGILHAASQNPGLFDSQATGP